MPTNTRNRFPSLIQAVAQLCLCVLTQSKSQPIFIPWTWRSVCTADVTPMAAGIPGNAPTSEVSLPHLEIPFSTHVMERNLPDDSSFVNVTCQVPNSDDLHWKFMDLRLWQQMVNINVDTQPSNRSVVYILHVHCSNGANISLPWPMKTEGMREVHVHNCGLMDRDILYQDPLVLEVPNELQKIEIRDCLSIVDVLSLRHILDTSKDNSLNISRAFDCGQDSTLEVFIRRNFTFMSVNEFRQFRNLHNANHNSSSQEDVRTNQNHVKPEDPLVTDSQSLISDHNGIPEMSDTLNISSMNDFSNPFSNLDLLSETDILEFMQKIMNTHSHCSYKKLRYQDESMTSDSFKYLIQFLAYGSEYPVLEVMNYSMVGMNSFPRGHQQWMLHFPRLRYVDLSYNQIPYIKGENFVFPFHGPKAIFNVRHNNITAMNMEVLNSWLAAGNSHIDARNNPIHCGCDMSSFIPFLQNATSFTGRFKEYEYVKVLACHSPPHLKGRELRSLTLSSLSCPTSESQIGWIISLAVILAIFVLLTIVLFRFKAEIRILLYTRLSIRLPWDADSQRQSKTYDAFVSYSKEDAKWVYQNIAALLESPLSSESNAGGSGGKSRGNHNHAVDANANGMNGHKNDKKNNKNNNNDKNNTKKNSGKDFPKSHLVAKGPFKLCLHQRDFIAGMTIMDNILESIEASRHTIVVLSPSFMQSHWAMEELRQAYRQSLVEKTRHLIVVLLEKISDADMDPLIKRCCKTFTYLDARDSIFRDRLVFSLTTKDRGARRRDRYAKTQPELQSQDVESGCYNNDVYAVIDKPSPPARELSNMSCSSNTELTGSFH